MIPRDYHENKPYQWHYYPAKWYHLRYKGGRFVFFRHQKIDSTPEQTEILKRGLEFGAQIAKDDRGTWTSSIRENYTRYEVVVIACKDKDDAVIFKLAIL